jgi:hypothetical protein
MVLTRAIEKQVIDFVKQKPRSINEIAGLLKVNWRTADRYIQKICDESGSLAVRTFREGTRGALKVAYFSGLESNAFPDLQAELFERIKSASNKFDFSPFEIYQFLGDNEKNAFLEEQPDEPRQVKQDLLKLFSSAERQLLFFSGNFSWINIVQEKTSLMQLFKKLTGKGIQIKALCNIDFNSIDNIEKLLSLNPRGQALIEIRHYRQPLRGVIIDDKAMRFKEIKSELKGKEKVFIFYELRNKEWVEWMQKVFMRLFQKGIPAEKRLKELKSIKVRKNAGEIKLHRHN